MSTTPAPAKKSPRRSSVTYFFLRGVAITLPPVLTLLILLWAGNGFNTYVIVPINTVVRYALASSRNDIRTRGQLVPPSSKLPPLPDWQRNYLVTNDLNSKLGDLTGISRDLLLSEEWNREVFVPIGRGTEMRQYVPLADYDFVFKQIRPIPPPTTAIGLYMEMVAVRDRAEVWQYTLLALSVTIIGLYFLGRFVTARIGKWFVTKLEAMLVRLPLVRNVYPTVKQVTDFILSDREVEFQRVVALEYPRAGSWTLGFVTGEGMRDCATELGEAMLTILVPTSPVPAGGFTVMVTRSSVIDLNLTIDQAVQFVVSCGVLIPPHQRAGSAELEQEVQKRLAAPEAVTSAATTAANPDA